MLKMLRESIHRKLLLTRIIIKHRRELSTLVTISSMDLSARRNSTGRPLGSTPKISHILTRLLKI